jgi:hypothetical protein
MGLNTLEERVKGMQENVKLNNLSPPKDNLKRESEMIEF